MLNYIPIPTNLHQSGKVLAMMAREGAHGYGVFLLLLQLARDDENRRLTADIAQLSYAIRETDTAGQAVAWNVSYRIKYHNAKYGGSEGIAYSEIFISFSELSGALKDFFKPVNMA